MKYFFIVTIIFTLWTIVEILLKRKTAARIFLPLSLICWGILVLIFLFLHVGLLILFVLYVVVMTYIATKRYYKLGVKEIQYSSKKLKNNYKAVFLADFQFDLGPGRINKKAFENVISKTNELEKDVILLGGDYINYAQNIEYFTSMIDKLDRPKLGIYAIIGNHDYVDYDKMVNCFEDIGVKVIENTADEICEDLRIIGVEDVWFGNPKLDNYGNDKYNLCIAHNPDFVYDVNIDDNLDLALSGHYHSGQFNLFFFKFPRLLTKFVDGKHQYKGANLYISSGLGGSFMRGKVGLHIRLFADPEITVINLNKE